MLGSKKIHTRNFDNEKNSCGLKIPPPPLMDGPSLIDVISFSRCASIRSLYLFPFSFGSSPVL